MTEQSVQFDGTEEPPLGTRRWLRRSRSEPSFSTDEYELGEYAKHPDTLESGWRSHLRASVSHTPAQVSYAYGHEANLPDWMDQPSPASLKDLATPGPGGQEKLFGMDTKPGHSTLWFAQSTKPARINFPTVMAMAAADTMRDFGRTLKPDDDLSPHSERIVQHLKESGHVDPSFRKGNANKMDFRYEPKGINPDEIGGPAPTRSRRSGAMVGNYQFVPEANVREAKNTARKIAKSRRKKS